MVVAPLVGAWIEIYIRKDIPVYEVVALLADAWIEISVNRLWISSVMRRPPRGYVD